MYILLSAKRRAYFCKSIAIEMGGVLRYFSESIGVRGRCDSPEVRWVAVKPEAAITAETAKKNRQNYHGCLLVLHFVGQAQGEQGALKANPPPLKPKHPFSDILKCTQGRGAICKITTRETIYKYGCNLTGWVVVNPKIPRFILKRPPRTPPPTFCCFLCYYLP